jgi:hypothetical protein
MYWRILEAMEFTRILKSQLLDCPLRLHRAKD